MLGSIFSKSIEKISFFILITILLISIPTQAQYSGGTGEPNDPYQIAEPNDWIEFMNSEADWDKNFIMTADIDLNDVSLTPIGYNGKFFKGIFDGNDHIIYNVYINRPNSGYIGLFGYVYYGQIHNLGLINVKIIGDDLVGGLVGINYCGDVNCCYTSGLINGDFETSFRVGGLIGTNVGNINRCYSTALVKGYQSVGGLVGLNTKGDNDGTINFCYSNGTVKGIASVGGLVGSNISKVNFCYSNSAVSGDYSVGGLSGGGNTSKINYCYSTGSVNGNSSTGGLVGGHNNGQVNTCFWDVQSSGQTWSAGGTGKTTAEMQTQSTFTDFGWDFVGETINGPNDVWKIVEGVTYPLLSWQKYSGGSGEPNDPYQIAEPNDWVELMNTSDDWNKYFVMINDIDLDGLSLSPVGISYYESFTGIFDGNNHIVYNAEINTPDSDYIGLFGYLNINAQIHNVTLEQITITGNRCVGGLVGYNNYGTIINCYSNGTINGSWIVGGLIGYNNYGYVTDCFSSGLASSKAEYAGGLVGNNKAGNIINSTSNSMASGTIFIGGLTGYNSGDVNNCCSTGIALGNYYVGGLVGTSDMNINNCYSISISSGQIWVGGLVGINYGNINNCYSAGAVTGNYYTGGLVGTNINGYINECLWDIQTSGQSTSDSGTGKTTSEMQTQSTFTDSGWDFIDETINGDEDIWWIDEGVDYPRLRWELITEE